MKNGTEEVCVFGIDCQNDFCAPAGTPNFTSGGSLLVAGANADMERVGKMIKKYKGMIDGIELTFDSHQRIHVAHAISWKDKNGNHPPPFTLITAEEVANGRWMAYNPGFQTKYEEYVKALYANGRNPLVIWPEHCLIGSYGQVLYYPIWDAVYEWEGEYNCAGKTTKGSSLFTEHYSAVKADVEDPGDLGTKLNDRLIKVLKKYDHVLIVGEALSHCVANTITDVANEFGDTLMKKLVLLEDACSSVTDPPGTKIFTKMAEDFVNKMTARGMRTSKTTNFF